MIFAFQNPFFDPDLIFRRIAGSLPGLHDKIMVFPISFEIRQPQGMMSQGMGSQWNRTDSLDYITRNFSQIGILPDEFRLHNFFHGDYYALPGGQRPVYISSKGSGDNGVPFWISRPSMGQADV